MNRSLIALWVVLLSAVATIVVVSLFWARQRDANARARVSEILETQLQPLDDSIARVVENYSLELQRELGVKDLGSLIDCVEVTRLPIVTSFVVVNHKGELLYPQHLSSQSVDTQSLVAEAMQLISEQGDPRPNSNRISDNQGGRRLSEPSDLPSQDVAPRRSLSNSFQSRSYTLQSTDGKQSEDRQREGAVVETPGRSGRVAGEIESTQEKTDDAEVAFQTSGWITWYHRRGMVLGYWWHQGEDWRSITVLPRPRWMADIIAALPNAMPQAEDLETGASGTAVGLQGSLKQLVDVEGNVIYQWSNLPLSQWDQLVARQPDAELAVSAPLEGWRLRIYASESLRSKLGGDGFRLPLWFAIGGITTALLLIGVLVSVNLNRQVRLATQRVSFVNQVSHELRTPLTNICMYADLLADSIDKSTESNGGQHERISVIQSESRRLNRLIGNVLQFARSGAAKKALRVRSAVLDEIVLEVVETFRPRLVEAGFNTSLDLNTPNSRELDPDAIEQMLVNLIGNAEKYAASGQELRISTKPDGEDVQFTVSDAGPGVSQRFRKKIFEPFFRASDRLEDPAGTGIGLTIVRDLAYRHGGRCELVDSERGAVFCCIVHAPVVSPRGDHERDT